ncbi:MULTISPECIES: phage tail protein [Paenibacillus]|uniref:Tail Collar domain-containing protein n=1 Tax=Paenibacillus vini TaxID=1476024 RepID=A0ABQ4MHA4_9BACL|nr:MULTISPECIES: tail fiber protein [Paenibacillus]MBQ4897607.1 phage tail protein [Paenibacillus sp. Marseille-P2973]GIP55365.1 tail Collar domain-containing protein [Paenibacillus vini]
MSEPFLGEIRSFSFGIVPKGWAACNGQTLPIHQNQALYSLLGTIYGGDGVTTFALPDLRGRVPVHPGNGVQLGQSAGEEHHTLTVQEMPQHTHFVFGAGTSSSNKAANNVWGTAPSSMYAAEATTQMSSNALSTTGQSQPHNNMQPYNVLSFCIAINGIYPSRN